ncbi:ATP-dependent nuclease [Microtetraspora malaysiensis]|uniref:ATP-dependent nuclease n=1 Tax=Microtetraspora malaysiensis TaxID=161358 RepID=UPI003D8B7FEE
MFSVEGFRSLTEVKDIPVGGPTILAGHNDGGKTAVLGALGFLVGDYKFVDDDRTYLLSDGEEATQGQARTRCPSTSVEGVFLLDAWEQGTYLLPAELRIRRVAEDGSPERLECRMPVPDDERLRDLKVWNAPDLKKLVQELGLVAASTRRADLEAALRSHAAEHSGAEGWAPLPSGLEARLPRLLRFDGRTPKPDAAVKTALMGRFKHHMEDEQLTGSLRGLEEQVQEQLRIDAKSLCDHIKERCPDLAEVAVDPNVSFDYGFKSAEIKISRTTGEPVGLDRSGQGSSRRISLAIWEWTSELLADDSATEVTDVAGAQELPQPPTQTIIVYDEPDTHLDYDHQRKIMRLIREQSAIPHVRVIVATHSMSLIDGVDIGDVVNLKLQDGRTVVERMGTDEHDEIDAHLRQIAASVGLRNTVLLHERCFLAVEGDTEQQCVPLLFRLAEGLSLQAAGIALWACSNNEGALHLARYLHRHGRSVKLMVDADSRNSPGGLFKENRLIGFFGKDAHAIVDFVGEPEGFNELEEIFLDETWATVANKIWPRTEGEWSAADFAAVRGGKKFSHDVWTMLRDSSFQGPGGKPEMMCQLTLSLDSASQVPKQLREVFDELRESAGG